MKHGDSVRAVFVKVDLCHSYRTEKEDIKELDFEAPCHGLMKELG